MDKSLNKTKRVNSSKGDDVGTIESLISFLEKAKRGGATHYRMTWTNDPIWAFKFFETFRYQTEVELIEAQIEELQNKKKDLTG